MVGFCWGYEDFYDYTYSGFGYYSVEATGTFYDENKEKIQPKVFNGIYRRTMTDGVKRNNFNRKILPCNNYNVQ